MTKQSKQSTHSKLRPWSRAPAIAARRARELRFVPRRLQPWQRLHAALNPIDCHRLHPILGMIALRRMPRHAKCNRQNR